MTLGASETQSGRSCISCRIWFSSPMKSDPFQNSSKRVAGEVRLEDEARDDRADRQHAERDEHHERRFMRLVIVPMAVVVMTVIVVAVRMRA